MKNAILKVKLIVFAVVITFTSTYLYSCDEDDSIFGCWYSRIDIKAGMLDTMKLQLKNDDNPIFTEEELTEVFASIDTECYKCFVLEFTEEGTFTTKPHNLEEYFESAEKLMKEYCGKMAELMVEKDPSLTVEATYDKMYSKLEFSLYYERLSLESAESPTVYFRLNGNKIYLSDTKPVEDNTYFCFSLNDGVLTLTDMVNEGQSIDSFEGISSFPIKCSRRKP